MFALPPVSPDSFATGIYRDNNIENSSNHDYRPVRNYYAHYAEELNKKSSCWECSAGHYASFGHAFGTTGPLLWMIIFGIALHGMAYDFFFVTGQIYIDRRAPKEIRSSAQGLLYFLTLGAGMLSGNLVLSKLYAHFSHVVEKVGADGIMKEVTVYDWPSIWYIGAGMSAAVFLMFAVAFKDKEAVEEVDVKAHTRKPMKAWAVAGSIVKHMFILSFSLQYYLYPSPPVQPLG